MREIGHEMLRRGERRTLTKKSVRENEAEAYFVVCQAIGLENGSSAAKYIQIWNGGANLLRESLKPSSKPQPSSSIPLALTPGVCADHDGAVLPVLRPFLSCRWHLFFPALPSAHISKPFLEVSQEVLLIHCNVDGFTFPRLGAHPPSQLLGQGVHMSSAAHYRHSGFLPTLCHRRRLAQEFCDRAPAPQPIPFGFRVWPFVVQDGRGRMTRFRCLLPLQRCRFVSLFQFTPAVFLTFLRHCGSHRVWH